MSEPEHYAEIEIGDTRDDIYEMGVCGDCHLHVQIAPPDAPNCIMGLVFLTPEAAYDFAQALLRGYDYMVGIAEPSRKAAAL